MAAKWCRIFWLWFVDRSDRVYGQCPATEYVNTINSWGGTYNTIRWTAVFCPAVVPPHNSVNRNTTQGQPQVVSCHGCCPESAVQEVPPSVECRITAWPCWALPMTSHPVSASAKESLTVLLPAPMRGMISPDTGGDSAPSNRTTSKYPPAGE